MAAGFLCGFLGPVRPGIFAKALPRDDSGNARSYSRRTDPDLVRFEEYKYIF